MTTHVSLYTCGVFSGMILKEKIIAIYSAQDEEATITIELENGRHISHYAGYGDEHADELARMISDMGWSD